MRLLFPLLIFLVFLGVVRAQPGTPFLQRSISPQALAPGGDAVTIDLRNHFAVDGVTSDAEFAEFETSLGRFHVELLHAAAPRHVQNFMTYVEAGDYANSIVHRAVALEANGVSLVQGGAYRNPPTLADVPRRAPLLNEYQVPNVRGTLAAGRDAGSDAASCEWFLNTRDNEDVFGPGTGEGMTVFGRVLGAGMEVVDRIATLPRTAAAGLTDVPVQNFAGGALGAEHFVLIKGIRLASLFPTGGGESVITLELENSRPDVVATVLSGTTLTLTPMAPGTAQLTVWATDVHGARASATFEVTVPGTAPLIAAQPLSQTVAAGSTVVLQAPATGAASYYWVRDGQVIANGTSALVLEGVTAAQSGTYTLFATNALGTTMSDTATVVVQDSDPVTAGRLVNLSILTRAGAGARVLTVGAVVGPFDLAGALPMVVRAVGPTLGGDPFRVPGVLTDPTVTLFAAGTTDPIETNDDWGGAAGLAEAFSSVGAFSLPGSSRDSALVRPSPGLGVGGYTVQVSGKADMDGAVLAEIYDASGSARHAHAPRLINVSTLAQVDAGADLAAGFVIAGGTARTVLIRGVGPSLTTLGVTGVMADPRLVLYDNNTGRRLGGSEDWGGALEVAAAAARVGAFPLSGGLSKDAAWLVTLPPGAYSARISDAAGIGGVAIVEVYEVP